MLAKGVDEGLSAETLKLPSPGNRTPKAAPPPYPNTLKGFRVGDLGFRV